MVHVSDFALHERSRPTDGRRRGDGGGTFNIVLTYFSMLLTSKLYVIVEAQTVLDISDNENLQ